MNINYLSVLIAAVAQFVVGAIWYMPLFGKLWGKIHGYNSVSKAQQAKMMQQMMPLLGVQFLMTLVTTVVLAIFISNQPTWNAYAMAGFFWVGFIVPTQVAGVIFGGTVPKWILTKIAIQAGASLICVEVAAYIIRLML